MTDRLAIVSDNNLRYANGGVHWEQDEQRPNFEQHWLAVERAGFRSHVRGSNNGAFLMLRNDKEQ